ncbi:hypothetical protein J4447_03660 [Candidatus Pacearchaeota archaeon]|nr:hypothetical protein [Candidatus Pacearchaeota archaeon]
MNKKSEYQNALARARELRERFQAAVSAQGYSMQRNNERSTRGQEIYFISRDGRLGTKRELMIEYGERGLITRVQLAGSNDDLEDYAELAFHLKEVNDLQRREGKPVFETSWPFSNEALARRMQRRVMQIIDDRKRGGLVARFYQERARVEKTDHTYEPS